MHAVVAARLGQTEAALDHFHKTAAIDLGPSVASSAGGIRIAAQGALWQIAVLGFAGLGVTGDSLRLKPALPAPWRSMAFRICWRGRRLHFHLQTDPAVVTASLEAGEPVVLSVDDQQRSLASDKPERFDWRRGASR